MPKPLDPVEIRTRLDLLEADLLTLMPLVVKHGSPVLEGEIRAASAILRRWFHEGELGRLTNALSVKPTFPVLTNDQLIAQLPQREDVSFYLAAGIAFHGRPVLNVYSSTLPFEGCPRLDVGSSRPAWVSTKAFLSQPCLYFEGRLFSRQEVIVFMANKLGGVHIDFNRNHEQAVLERASQFMTFGGPPEQAERGLPGSMHLELEPRGREILSGLHLEIVAAGAALLQVRFDGKPFMAVQQKVGLGSRIRKLSGLGRRRLRARLHEAASSEVD